MTLESPAWLPIDGYEPPIRWWIGLALEITAVIEFDGSGFVEPVGNGYGRVALNDRVWPPVPHDNVNPIRFPDPVGDGWGRIAWWGVFPNPDGGLPQWFGKLTAPIYIGRGNCPVEFAPGSVLIP